MSHFPVEAVAIELGQRLRDLRISRGLTIRAAADASGLSVNTLSLIENGHTSPSVSTLQALARTLEVPLAEFFAEREQQAAVVFSRCGERSLTDSSSVQLEPLAHGLFSSAFQPMVVHLPAGAHSGDQAITHSGVEMIFCLAGRFVAMVASQTYTLEAGDSLVFDSTLNHGWHNPESDDARFLLVMCPGINIQTPSQRHFGV